MVKIVLKFRFYATFIISMAEAHIIAILPEILSVYIKVNFLANPCSVGALSSQIGILAIGK